jgi:hypothetical protein
MKLFPRHDHHICLTRLYIWQTLQDLDLPDSIWRRLTPSVKKAIAKESLSLVALRDRIEDSE